MRTVVGATTGDADTLDHAATYEAGLALTTEQLRAFEPTVAMPFILHECRIRSVGVRHRVVQDDAYRATHAAQLTWREACGRTARVNVRAKQDFVRVDIADAGDCLLIEQHGLDRSETVPGKLLPEAGQREPAAERLRTHT